MATHAADCAAERPSGCAAGGLAATDILVAEDDPAIAGLIQKALEDEGYRVTAVTSGQAVLEAVAHRQPDLLLLDVRLEPGISGWEVMQRMEAMDQVVPTVLVTADGSTLAAGGENGDGGPPQAAAVLAKPFDLDELLAVVERCRASRN